MPSRCSPATTAWSWSGRGVASTPSTWWLRPAPPPHGGGVSSSHSTPCGRTRTGESAATRTWRPWGSGWVSSAAPCSDPCRSTRHSSIHRPTRVPTSRSAGWPITSSTSTSPRCPSSKRRPRRAGCWGRTSSGVGWSRRTSRPSWTTRRCPACAAECWRRWRTRWSPGAPHGERPSAPSWTNIPSSWPTPAFAPPPNGPGDHRQWAYPEMTSLATMSQPWPTTCTPNGPPPSNWRRPPTRPRSTPTSRSASIPKASILAGRRSPSFPARTAARRRTSFLPRGRTGPFRRFTPRG